MRASAIAVLDKGALAGVKPGQRVDVLGDSVSLKVYKVDDYRAYAQGVTSRPVQKDANVMILLGK